MATLELYKEKYRYLSRSEVAEERRQILHSINGVPFFPLDWWPDDMKLLFWKKPVADLDTFKLVLFLLGNGCPPDLFRRWILSPQFWATPQLAEKRARQVDFILNDRYFLSSSYYERHAFYRKHFWCFSAFRTKNIHISCLLLPARYCYDRYSLSSKYHEPHAFYGKHFWCFSTFRTKNIHIVSVAASALLL